MAKPLKVAHPPNFILANTVGSQMIFGVLIDINMTKKLAVKNLVILPTVGRKMDMKLEKWSTFKIHNTLPIKATNF